MIKDGHDFSSAVWTSAQHEDQVLWAVGFVSPGGDEHIGLHQIARGEAFDVSALRLVAELCETGPYEVSVDGTPTTASGPLAPGQRVTVLTAGAEAQLSIDKVRFGSRDVELSLELTDDRAAVIADLLPRGPERLVLADIEIASLVGTFSLRDRTQGPAPTADPLVTIADGLTTARWRCRDGHVLGLVASAVVGSREEHVAAAVATLDDHGQPVD